MALRGYPARIGLSGRQVTEVSFLHGAITRMAAGKRQGERERRERREEVPPSAQEHTQKVIIRMHEKPIGSNVHFSFSPSAIGLRNRVGSTERTKRNGVMFPEETHLSRRCGASAPPGPYPAMWRKHVCM